MKGPEFVTLFLCKSGIHKLNRTLRRGVPEVGEGEWRWGGVQNRQLSVVNLHLLTGKEPKRPHLISVFMYA